MKPIDYDLKIKINGKRLYESSFVKYLCILIDPYLKWNYHVDLIAPKLSRAIGKLSKVRHFVNSSTLRLIDYGIFHQPRPMPLKYRVKFQTNISTG